MKTKRILLSVFAVLLFVVMLGGVIAVGYDAFVNELGNRVVIDKDNNLPVVKPSKGSANVETENGMTTSEVTLEATGVTAIIPEGTKLDDGVNKVTLSVKPIENSNANITLEANEEKASYDIHIEGVSKDNTAPIKVYVKEMLPKGLNMGNYKLYHVENGETVEMTLLTDGEAPVHNSFDYDTVTGDVNLYLASFSEVAVVADTENAWNGTYDYEFVGDGTQENPYIISSADELAGFGAIVGGMNGQARNSYKGNFVKLIADINLGYGVENHTYRMFHPIGYYYTDDKNADGTTGDYYSSVYSFEGTFDGNGHTIANFYHNTWEIKGDYSGNYYCDAMGLFGYVTNGTVQNLTVDNFSSDGEFTPTGVIAAYAVNSTFANIAITNCNPRVYNTGNGGIVGIGGNSDDPDTYKLTFTNITIDNTNKISALWGSWDVACGGLVGMFRGAGHAYMTNCHVAAQIDVYNDVCGNYQYYWYRYAGMMIGTNKNMTTDENGYTVPETDKFHAESCTVHFGDWNDYYYCELVANSLASYTHDHQFSRLEIIDSLDEIKSGNEWTKTGNFLLISGDTKTCYHIVKNDEGKLVQHLHTDAGYEDEKGIDENGDGEIDLREDKQIVYLPFNQLFTGYGWGVKHIPVYNGENYAFKGITILDREVANSVEKFDKLFTGDFLYRVGNKNTVSLGSLFAAKNNAQINNSGVWVTIEKVDEKSNVSGTFTANTTDWTKATIQFSGTGVVKITIQDYNYCTPTTLLLEVVDAKNATTAASATANNVVLLQDVSGSFSVSGGHSLYGNGFKVTLPTTSQSKYSAGFVGYVTIMGGNLDNVQIVGPTYPVANIYREQSKDSADETKANYFYNSVIITSGNCTISNSYISGSRSAVCIRGANNVIIENSTIEGGAAANIDIETALSVTLKNVTTVQKETPDSYGQNKDIIGMGVSVFSGTTDIKIEGELNQYNWVNEDQWNAMVPSSYREFFPKFFTGTDYKDFQVTYNNETYVNLGFIFSCNWDKEKIHDNRTDKTLTYTAKPVSLLEFDGGVFSITGLGTLENALYDAPKYSSSKNNPVAPVFNYDNTANDDADDENDIADAYCVYDEASGILKIGITGSEKTIDLSGVAIAKNGIALSYTAYLNGTQISGNSVTIKATDGAKQTLTFKATTDDAGFDKNGNPITGSIEYTWTITLEVATLAFPAPVWNMGGDYQFDTSNCFYAYYQTSQGYGEAVPIYEGIKINYYNKSGTLVNLDLSGTTTLPTGSANSNTNAFTYTLADGSTLTMKFSSGWKRGATTHQFAIYNSKTYIYPQSLDNDNYVRAKTTNQDFDVKITYTFTDPNGQSTGAQTMQWYNAKADNGSVSTVQWKKFDSTNGKEPECITEGTLITMADGTQKAVEDLVVGDMVMIFNHVTGQIEAMPIIFNTHSDDVVAKNYDVLHLEFSNNSELEIVSSHGLFDMTLMQYVYIGYENYQDYIGHEFYSLNGENNGGERITLTNAFISNELTRIFCPVTYFHMNSFANGLLNTPSIPGDITGLVNYFEYDEDLKYNEEAMQRDIDKYGLYTYEDFSEYISEEAFNSSPSVYLKVAVGKGMITYEEIIAVIEYLLAGSLIH